MPADCLETIQWLFYVLSRFELNIKDYQFHERLLLRTPCYSYHDYERATLADLLKDAYFLSAIRAASPIVFTELEKAGFKEDLITDKLKFTLFKYFNRMCHRPTPFGLFAGVSTVGWTDDHSICLSKELKVHIQPDFKSLVNSDDSIDNLKYRSNPSLYKVLNSYRYIFVEPDQEDGKSSYGINKVIRNAFLDALLDFTKEEKSKADMIEFLQLKFNIETGASKNFIHQLIACQLLVAPDKQKAIITSANRSSIKSIIPTHESTVMPMEELADKYINVERPVITNGLNHRLQNELFAAIEVIQKIAMPANNEDMVEFKKRFTKKFDLQTLPLLKALDPEVGVGYAGLGSMQNKPVICPEEKTTPSAEHDVKWSLVHALFAKRWKEVKYGDVLEIKDEDLNDLSIETGEGSYSPSSSVMFRAIGEHVYLEQFGAVTGTSLIGRFSTISNDVMGIASAIANDEVSANPQVLFAEINHYSDLRIANIEQRQSFYPYEIPVLSPSSVADERQIQLADLQVTVQGKEVWLTSAKLGGKRVIPRLSSAYNYQRSDLAVFRFLCDLQQEGLGPMSYFHLSNFLPKLPNYPRVVYKNVILQLATWTFKGKVLSNATQSLQEVQNFIGSNKLPRFFSIDIHDNQLVFDTSKEADLQLFQHCIDRKKQITISEYPFISEGQVVKDNDGKQYINQFVASIYHNKDVYKAYDIQKSDSKQIRNFLPGSEWTSFKIYLHPATANEVIVNYIVPVIDKLEQTGLLKKWFFIRYADPDYHIRLRMNAEPQNSWKIVRQVYQTLEVIGQSEIIGNIILCKYVRELERYGEHIELAETLFNASSRLVVHQLLDSDTNETQLAHYHFAISSIHDMLNSAEVPIADRIKLFRQLYQSFGTEFNFEAREVQQKLRELRESGALLSLYDTLNRESSAFSQAHKILVSIALDEVKLAFLGDLIHMHLNRYFVVTPRLQELVIYYTLWKGYVSVQQQSLAVAKHPVIDQLK